MVCRLVLVCCVSMYKRRDWMHLHGQDGGASDSSDDSGSESQHTDDDMAKASGSSDSEADSGAMAAHGEPGTVSESGSDGSASSGNGSVGDEDGSLGGYDSEVSEPISRRRLEDLSEEDFDSEDDDEDLEEVKRTWLGIADAEPEHTPAGRALKCRACNGKLLLNALALQQHIASKRHLRKAKDVGEEPTDSICFADQLANNENVETHQERMQRLQQEENRQPQSAAEPAASKSSGAAKRRRKQQRKAAAAAGAEGSKASKKRLGKRQRAALKQDGPAAALSGADAGKQKQPKRRKVAATH